MKLLLESFDESLGESLDESDGAVKLVPSGALARSALEFVAKLSRLW